MSHDKKKAKKVVADPHVLVQVVGDAAKGSSGTAQKETGDARIGGKNAAVESKKGSTKHHS
jgi:hypothetical protein